MEKLGKVMSSILLLMLLLTASSSSIISSANAQTDFFYLILKWPGAQCSTKEGCCLPKTTKHARDFIITGFQPFYFNGTFPKNCDSYNRFNISKISHLVPRLEMHWPSFTCPTSSSEKLWSNEWLTYGTCSESTLSMHEYFRAALKRRKSANLLKVLADAGIQPNGSFYEVDKITDAIVQAGLHYPGIGCTTDKYGKLQFNRVILCSDNNGKSIVECPGLPLASQCSGTAKFAAY